MAMIVPVYDAWRAMIPVDELFETVVDSAFVGVRKPDPRIYELILGRVDLPAEACIFIDDMKVNLPPDELLSQVSFLTPAQIAAASDVLAENWGPMVADA